MVGASEIEHGADKVRVNKHTHKYIPTLILDFIIFLVARYRFSVVNFSSKCGLCVELDCLKSC